MRLLLLCWHYIVLCFRVLFCVFVALVVVVWCWCFKVLRVSRCLVLLLPQTETRETCTHTSWHTSFSLDALVPPVRPTPVLSLSVGVQCEPIFSKILSLYAEQNDLKFAVPGGLIGVGTRVDPTLTRADRLVGQVLGLKGNLPDVFTEVCVCPCGRRRWLFVGGGVFLSCKLV